MGDIRRRTVNRLEHRWRAAVRIDIRRSRKAESPLDGGTEIGEDITKQIGSDDDIERFGCHDETGGNRIDDHAALVAAFGPSARIEWAWQREDEDEWSTILSTDGRLSNDGFALSVSPADVDARTSFEASVVTD